MRPPGSATMLPSGVRTIRTMDFFSLHSPHPIQVRIGTFFGINPLFLRCSLYDRIPVLVHGIPVLIYVLDFFLFVSTIQIVLIAEARGILRLRLILNINLISGQS